MAPEVQGQGQGNPPDNRASAGAGNNQAGTGTEEPQATQQEGRCPDRHVPAAVPHRPASPWRQAQARLKHRPAPYTPPLKRVAPTPPPPGATEEAPVEAGRRNPPRVAKQEAWGMIHALTGHFSSDSDQKPPAPRPHRRRGGGRSRIEKRNQAPRLRGPTLTIFRPLGKEGQ